MILHICLPTVQSHQFNLKLVLKVSYNTNIKMYFFNTYVYVENIKSSLLKHYKF